MIVKASELSDPCRRMVTKTTIDMQQRSVLDLKMGEEAMVKAFSDSRIACNLLTIGIIPDTPIAMIRKAPFGGAVCLKLGRTFIAVRTIEAKSILIH